MTPSRTASSQDVPALASWLAPFQSEAFTPDAVAQLDRLRARLRTAAGAAEARRLLDAAGDIYVERPHALWHFLLTETKSQWALDGLASVLAGRPSLAEFCEALWALKRMSFTDAEIAALDFDGVRRAFLTLSERVRRLRTTPARPGGGALRKVAILSPQLLGLRHSPTREAIYLALRMKNEHGLDVTLFNLNAMSYANQLGLAEPFIANHNPDLKGVVNLQTGVAGFRDADVVSISLPASRLTAEKILGVLDLLAALEIDVVLSHADNHFFQDAVFGSIPSLFLTTGEVLPFARSDAYWAPGSLVNAGHDRLAAAFGGGPILREQMFTSPEDVSALPAARAALGVDADAVVFLVIGTRLEVELDAGFAAVLDGLLSQFPTAVVLFCGSPALDLAQLFDAGRVADGRLRNLGFRDDLAAICKAADICLNPRRSGGGTSAQTAILCGAPVVTLAEGHVSDIAPPDRRWGDLTGYGDYARRIAADAALRAAEARHFREYLERTASPSGQVARLVGYMGELHRDGALRR